jgi:hypothetical protein
VADYTTVAVVYDQSCYVLLEDWQLGVLPGLFLGVVTPQVWLDYFGLAFQDFLSKTGFSLTIFTQQVRSYIPQYQVPVDIAQLQHCFLGGTYLERVNQQAMDDFNGSWEANATTPQFWFEDGLPIKTVQLSPAPYLSGVPYRVPDPDPGPPYGIYGQINPLDGNLTMIGTSGANAVTLNFAYNTIIPVIPDSFCIYLGYAVLQKIFSTDGEAKDEQRAAYCASRVAEGFALAQSFTGNVGSIGS